MTMFNRVFAVLAAAVLANSSWTASAQEARQRYSITTKGSPRAVLQRVGTNVAGEPAMRVRTFANLDGFAAELTAAEAAALRETAGVKSVDPVVPRYASQVVENFPPVNLENFDKQITPWGVPIVRAAARTAICDGSQ